MSIHNALAEYFLHAPLRHKISDLALVLLTAALGFFLYVNINSPPPHTVESSLEIVRHVQEVLSQQQLRHNWLFIGHYRLHNGQSSMSKFNFVKSSLGEYVSVDNINYNDHQTIPIAAQIPLVARLVNNQCYIETIDDQHILYYAYQFTQITSLTSCPVRHRGLLTGYITVGHNTPVAPEVVSTIANRIQEWQ